MRLLKKYISASSLLESVIATALISACIYISLLVYNQIFSKQIDNEINLEEKNANAFFYELQANQDSIITNENYHFIEEIDSVNARVITILPKDTLKVKFKKQFVINE